tara:strand:+ start:8153 stop:8422 length:270 start_codon:yes stop_codon:yes gene_type:complete
VVKKVFSTFLLIGLLFPTIIEAGVSPEGNPNRPKNHFPEGRPKKKKRCKGSGGVTVCRMPRKPKKCSLKRPCVPPKYYRPNPPRFIPMG